MAAKYMAHMPTDAIETISQLEEEEASINRSGPGAVVDTTGMFLAESRNTRGRRHPGSWIAERLEALILPTDQEPVLRLFKYV